MVFTDGQLVQNDEQISDSWFDLENECSDMTYQWLILKVKEAVVVVIYNYICSQCQSTLNLWVRITLMVIHFLNQIKSRRFAHHFVLIDHQSFYNTHLMITLWEI
jgi:hypothetical protein